MAEPQKQPTADAAEAAMNQQIAQIAKQTGQPEEQIRQQMIAAQKDPLMPTLMGMTKALIDNFNSMAGAVNRQAERLDREDAAAGIAADQRRTVPVADFKAVFDANAAVVTALIAVKQEQRAAAEFAAKQPRPAPANGNIPSTGQYL